MYKFATMGVTTTFTAMEHNGASTSLSSKYHPRPKSLEKYKLRSVMRDTWKLNWVLNESCQLKNQGN